MSNQYKRGDRVPSEVLAARLDELSRVVTEGPDAVRREFTMRVPAELDRDADLVLQEAAARIRTLEALIAPAQAAAEYLGMITGPRNTHGESILAKLRAALEKCDG